MESQSLHDIGTMHQVDFIYPHSIPYYEGKGWDWNGCYDSASFSHPDNIDNACGGPLISTYSSLEHVFEPRWSSYQSMHQLSSPNFSHGDHARKLDDGEGRSQTTPVAAGQWGGSLVLPQVMDPFHVPWPFPPEHVFEPRMRLSTHPMLQSTPSNFSQAYLIADPVYTSEGIQTLPAAAAQWGPDGGPPYASQKTDAPYVHWQPIPDASSSSHAYPIREPGYRPWTSQTFPAEAAQWDLDSGPPHPPQRTHAACMTWQSMPGFLHQPQHHPYLPLHQNQVQIEPDFGGLSTGTAAPLRGSQCVHEPPTSQLYAGNFWGVSGDLRFRQIVDGGSLSHYPPKETRQRTPGAGVAVSTVTSPSHAFRLPKRKAPDEGPSPSVETISKRIPCRALGKDDPLMQKYLGSTFNSVETATTAFFEANRFSCPVSGTCPFVAGTDGNIWVHLTSEHREVCGTYERGKDFQCPLGCAEEFKANSIERHLWSRQHTIPRYRLACVGAKCKVFPSAYPFYFKQHSETRSSDPEHSTGFRLINDEGWSVAGPYMRAKREKREKREKGDKWDKRDKRAKREKRAKRAKN